MHAILQSDGSRMTEHDIERLCSEHVSLCALCEMFPVSNGTLARLKAIENKLKAIGQFIEVKVRYDANESWDNLPIIPSNGYELTDLIDAIKNGSASELRWNYWGSMQGHYIRL